MRLFVSGLQKLATRMATLLTFGLLAGLLVMIDLAVATTRGAGSNGGGNPLALVTFPGAYDLILSFLFGLGGLFAVIATQPRAKCSGNVPSMAVSPIPSSEMPAIVDPMTAAATPMTNVMSRPMASTSAMAAKVASR